MFYPRSFLFAAFGLLIFLVFLAFQGPRATRAQTGPAPGPTSPQAGEAAVSAGLPLALPSDGLAGLPLDTTLLPAHLGLLVVPKPYLSTPAPDPQQGILFPKIAYAYVPAGPPGAQRLFCRVHHMTPDDAPLAARMACLLALAHDTLVRRTGRADWGGNAPFDVWLMRSGKAGGEQWQRNLYFYDLDASRSSIEWIREIIHEYSHLALPAIGGYKDPEYWASGYLGERLIVRWLRRRPDGPALVTQMWGDFSGAANFDRLLIAPALALYRKVGPSPHWLARTDGDGMRYLIGQVLTFDDRSGAPALAAALARLPREARAADLAEAFGQAAVHQAAPPPKSARRVSAAKARIRTQAQ